MTTFVRNGVTYTIVYIDPSIASAGDGSTAATALKNFPSSLANNKCYLVRRCDGTVGATWATGQSSVVNMMVLGMPKSTDEFYDLIDSDTKTAWDADTGDYGIITKSSSNSPNMSSAKQILFDKVYLNKTHTNSSFFTIGSGSESGSCNTFTFTNCKYGVLDCPLDDNTWIASNELTSTQKQYFACENPIYCKNVVIANNLINSFPYSSNSSNHLFDIGYCRSVEIRNNKINSASNPGNSTYMRQSSIFYVNSSSDPSIKFIDNELVYLIPSNVTTLGLQGLITIYGAGPLFIDGIKMTSKPMNGGSINTSSSFGDMTYDEIIWITNSTYPKYIHIKNIDVNLNENAGAKVSAAEIFKTEFYGSQAKQFDIDNISIHLCEDASQAVCNLRKTDKTAFTMNYSGLGGNGIVANNLTVIAPHMKALYLQGCGALNFDTVKGNISCLNTVSSYSPVINIDTLESLYPETSCIYVGGSNGGTQLLLHIGTLNVVNNTATPTTPQIQIGGTSTYDYMSTIFVDNSNCLLYTGNDWSWTGNTFNKDNAIICPNCVVTGQYYSMLSAGSVKASSAYRTGSNNTASLRFNRTNSSDYGVCAIGQDPYKGIMITPASAGSHTIKVYLATIGSGDAALFSSQFVISAYTRQYDSETDTYIDKNVVTTNSDGSIKTDTSTWNNISDYTAYVAEIPVYCYDTTPIEIKVDDLFYSNGFNVYLDTDIEIV